MLVDFLFFGAIAGIFCGMAPFLVARKRGRNDFATLSLIACGIAGALMGVILAGPLALILLAVLMVGHDA